MSDQTVEKARAVHRSYQMSASKVREVLDLIRGQSVVKAMERLSLTERGAAEVVAKVLRSAAANAANLYGLPPEELFVSATYADEGATLKRFRPRARGRAGRIRKRTSHIVIEVQRLSEGELRRLRERSRDDAAGRRARRVRSSRGARNDKNSPKIDEGSNSEASVVDSDALEASSVTMEVDSAPKGAVDIKEQNDDDTVADGEVEKN
ncbi:large subunit ribosomal protein L22 [Ferrithrix thermotolerans DSM 19514]|uniref:Large ribosomal subunit protein uL22 n=1 Tax=Ferrithrix thermotolerans DSM 19514 TaxID=1121881 RepID=A0A1M4SSL2_9ACTN|nr:large subunit ribosomal protein L22 [Ferrithrix thermotolerans DSM 19514]